MGLKSYAIAAIALLFQISLCGAAAADEERDSKIMAVLDEYLEALNLLDIERHVETYHFPHYRHAGAKITVWKNAREAMPILEVDASERRACCARRWPRIGIEANGPVARSCRVTPARFT